MRTFFFYVALALSLGFGACDSQDPAPPPDTDFVLPYRLNAPDTVFNLPTSLREISGLSCSADGRHLLAVNDEQGLVFHLNMRTGAIEQKVDFGKSGDYEGIAVAGQDVYVVNSSGSLFRINSSGKTKHYPTPLNGDFDVEGLCFDSSQNQLLLACKALAGKDSKFRNKKAIYAFELSKNKLAKKPAYVIDRAEIARWKGGSGGFMARVNEYFSSSLAPSAFSPSGLAFCPIDGNLYVIASVGKSLAVLRPDGNLVYAQRLQNSQMLQPEGICFDREGRLYISSEGKNGAPGRIFRFATIPN